MESENEESEEEEDVFDGPGTSITKVVNNEHSDPNSYSWLVLKLATLKIVQNRLTDFLAVNYRKIFFALKLFYFFLPGCGFGDERTSCG